MTIAVNIFLVFIAWFLLGIVLRNLRIRRRRRFLKRIADRYGNRLTELEVYGNELKPHYWRNEK